MIVCVVLIRENAENFMDYIYIAYFCGTIYMFSLLLQIDTRCLLLFVLLKLLLFVLLYISS
jgi:hypothetical protein